MNIFFKNLGILLVQKARNKHTWSLCLDLVQPLSKTFLIKGELFSGSNLSGYVGGISQGVNKTDANRPKEIDCQGGWVALCVKPIDNWTFNAGYGNGNPKDSDLSAISNANRRENSVVFGNTIYAINKNLDTGFELSYWKTKYSGLDKGKNLRGHFMMRIKF